MSIVLALQQMIALQTLAHYFSCASVTLFFMRLLPVLATEHQLQHSFMYLTIPVTSTSKINTNQYPPHMIIFFNSLKVEQIIIFPWYKTMLDCRQH